MFIFTDVFYVLACIVFVSVSVSVFEYLEKCYMNSMYYYTHFYNNVIYEDDDVDDDGYYYYYLLIIE